MKSTTCVERKLVEEIFKKEESVRKIIGSLPEREYFRQIEGSSKWPYVWEDELTPLLRICSKVPDPWNQEWEIYLSIQTNKRSRSRASNLRQLSRDASRYPARLDLQLSPIEEESRKSICSACLVRETAGGKVAYSSGKTLRFFVMEGKTPEMPVWVMLSVVEYGKTS
jgi:hypothetical protein